MEGVRQRLDREADADLVLAWDTAALSATAQAGKLKSLAHYRQQRRRSAAKQSPAQMLAALECWQSSGAPIAIRQLTHAVP